MPRLATIDPEQANGKLKEVYNGLQKKMGRVINVFQGMANSPAALNAYLSMSQALSEGQLSTEDREAIYLAVSEKNQCGYCVAAHNTIAKAAKMSDEQIAAIR